MSTDTALNATLRACLRRLQRGEILHMEVIQGERRFWFEGPYLAVPCAVAAELLGAPERGFALVGGGDDLFGVPGLSQTWTLLRRPNTRPHKKNREQRVQSN